MLVVTLPKGITINHDINLMSLYTPMMYNDILGISIITKAYIVYALDFAFSALDIILE